MESPIMAILASIQNRAITVCYTKRVFSLTFYLPQSRISDKMAVSESVYYLLDMFRITESKVIAIFSKNVLKYDRPLFKMAYFRFSYDGKI